MGPKAPETLRTEALLGIILLKQYNFLAASELFTNIANLCKEVYGAEHEVTLRSLLNYAVCAERLENKQEAIRLMTKVFDASTKLFGAEHPDAVTSAEWLTIWKATEDGEGA